MESNPQSNNTEQKPLKHNWSKFKPQIKELNDNINPDLPRNDAENLKPIVFSRKEKAQTIPSGQVRNTLASDVRKNPNYPLLMRYWDFHVKKAYDYIVEHPKMSYRSQFVIFKTAAEYGHPPGQYHLANSYFWGYGCEKSEKKALEWYAKARENGYTENSTFIRGDQSKSDEWCSIY